MGYEGKPSYDDIKQTSKCRYFAKYDQFFIGGSDTQYRLDVYWYHGNAWDRWSGMGVTTFSHVNL